MSMANYLFIVKHSRYGKEPSPFKVLLYTVYLLGQNYHSWLVGLSYNVVKLIISLIFKWKVFQNSVTHIYTNQNNKGINAS